MMTTLWFHFHRRKWTNFSYSAVTRCFSKENDDVTQCVLCLPTKLLNTMTTFA